ncbi:MAG: OmpA family protein [Saprospiraceae bacterium]
MRKHFLNLLTILLLSPLILGAQNREYPNALHVKFNLNDYSMLNGDELRVGEGFEFAYFRNIAPFLNVGVPLKLGIAKLPNTSGNTVTFSSDLVFHIENMRSGAKVVPYAFGGAGYFLEKFENGHAQFPFGVGLNFRLSPYGFINLQGEFRKALVDDRDNLQLGLGFVYLLHKEEPKPADTDGDGTADVLDHCPDLPGPAVALGCPDADNDGIGDEQDACPNDAGPLETNGCPDQDGDAVPDKDDQCPDLAGLIAMKGCPDTDKDGFADNADECPDQPGRWNGCPDTDFDGVPDKDDQCPTESGPAENKGCPPMVDTDKDGVADKDDRCPNEPGTADNQGCPPPADTDGDGVADKDDRCPNEAGSADNQGCPVKKESDRDGDGVPDKTDPCPDATGAFGGCPDTDGDGLADNLDKCPTMAGAAGSNGCPEVKKETKEKLATATQAVQFETGKAKLKSSSYAVLDEIIEILRQYPDYKLVISGHTDDVGDEDENQELSEQRAKACYDYLVFRGIKPERLRYAGFGEYRPIADNKTAEGRELNRRVEFELTTE